MDHPRYLTDKSWILPVYDFIDDTFLLLLSTLKIQPRRFNIFMTEEVRQQRDIRIGFQEIQRVPVPEDSNCFRLLIPAP